MTRQEYAKMIQDEVGGEWEHVKTHLNGTEVFVGSYDMLGKSARLSLPRGPYSGLRLIADESIRPSVLQGIIRVNSRFRGWNWNCEPVK